MKETLSFAAGLLSVAAFIPYIRAVLKKEARPSKATWMIWASLDIITLAGMFVEDAVNGQILGCSIGASVVFALAMKYGAPGWTRTDKFCLAGAVLGIALWAAFSRPVLGILTSIAIMLLGSIPTFMAAWRDPTTENRFAWAMFWASGVLAVIAIPKRTLAHAAQPLMFLAIDTVMMLILYARPPLLLRIRRRSAAPKTRCAQQ